MDSPFEIFMQPEYESKDPTQGNQHLPDAYETILRKGTVWRLFMTFFQERVILEILTIEWLQCTRVPELLSFKAQTRDIIIIIGETDTTLEVDQKDHNCYYYHGVLLC